MRRVRRLILIAVWLTSISVPARAEIGDYLGRNVASVQLMLDGKETVDPAFVQVVETRVGQPLSMIAVRESITHLFSLGRFENVRVDATLMESGVAIRYDLTPIHLVSKIKFAGNLDEPGIDTGDLRRAVTNRYGTSPLLSRASELARTVADTLEQRGYRRADVRPSAQVGRDSPEATLVFTIDPGPRTLIGAIEVLGAPTVSRKELLDKLDLAPGKPYEPDALNLRVTNYVDDRRKRGYYTARVTTETAFADNDRVVNLTVTATPGPLVRVVFTGDPLPEEQVGDLVPIEREGSVDEDLLEDSQNRVEEFLRGQGYREARAPYMRTEAGSELVITFAVSRGPQYRVSDLQLLGAQSVAETELRPLLRLRQAAPFSASALAADVSTLEDTYHRRGFAQVRIQTAVDPQASSANGTQVPVAVRLSISEGVRTVVGGVSFAGNQSVPDAELRTLVGLQQGAPFFEPQLERDRDAISLRYANLGYRTATVDAQAGLSAGGAMANPTFTIREGPRLIVDHILISGNLRTNAETIENEVTLKPGDPLGLAEVNETKRRLGALGLFRHVEIAELRHGGESQRDLLITVEESPPTIIGYGAGIEGRLRVVRTEEGGQGVAEQKFEMAPRAFFAIGRRNLFGKNRSVNLSTSVSLYPKDSPFFSNPASIASGSSGGFAFAEYRVLGALHEPRVFGTQLEGQLTATVERQIRSSFNLTRRGAGAQIGRSLSRNLSLTGSYQLQRTELLDVNVDIADIPYFIDRVFTQVRLSSVSLSGTYNTRDDALDPTRGEFLSATTQLAARAMWSEVGFIKTTLGAQAYRTVPGARRLVVAGSARLGLAEGFPRDVVGTDAQGNPVSQTDVRELPEAERFFAGGDTTIRGFAPDTVGVGETIKDGFPIGGNGLIIMNVELRLPLFEQRLPLVGGRITVVTFFDAGNVFVRATDLDLRQLRTAAGFGVRFGPLRIDWGYKLNTQPGDLAKSTSPFALGASAAFLSFGQAF